MSFSITGNAGIPGAAVGYTGTASGSVTADTQGNYQINGLVAGSYTLTPVLGSFVFSPLTASETITTANILGVNFTVPNASTAYSQPDCRVTPNSPVDIYGTQTYVAQSTPSYILPVDSRAAGLVVDSRVSVPQNSRTPGTFGPGE